jgi:hypothetical protein
MTSANKIQNPKRGLERGLKETIHKHELTEYSIHDKKITNKTGTLWTLSVCAFCCQY